MTLYNNPPFIVIFPKKNDIYCYSTLKELVTTFPSQQMNFTSAIVIDAKLKSYKVREAIRVGWGNKFFGINLLYKERVIKVEPVIENIETIDLAKAKELIIRSIETKPFGRFMKGIFGNKQNVIKKLEKVTSVTELMELFLYDD